MSGVKHTPGPWAVEDPMDHCLTIVANPEAPVYDWKLIATCDWPAEGDHDITSAEMKANARLIAAAPDLLEAAQNAVEEWGMRAGDDDALLPSAEQPESIAALMRAIARARGEL